MRFSKPSSDAAQPAPPAAIAGAYRNVRRALLVVVLLHATLVATHQGEFWPFSIYPMFSQAGRPWARALVRQVPPARPDSLLWKTVDLQTLPGVPFALQPHGISQIDLSDYLSRTTSWQAERRAGLHRIFRPGFSDSSAADRRLLVFQANGRLAPGAGVTVTATPLVWLTRDSLVLKPAYD